jgi:hypothetical protein
MDFSPTRQQRLSMRRYDFQCAAYVASLHPVYPNQRGAIIGSRKVDLGLAVAKDVDVSRFVVIHKYDEAQSLCPEDRDHDPC